MPHFLLLSLPTLVLGQGAFIQNYCPFPVSYYTDYNKSPGSDKQGIIPAGGGTFWEPYIQKPGRAIKLYPQGAGQGNLLVWGYTIDSNTPFVWSSLNEVGPGHVFDGYPITLIGNGGPTFDCERIQWPNGESDGKPDQGGNRVISCDKTKNINLYLC